MRFLQVKVAVAIMFVHQFLVEAQFPSEPFTVDGKVRHLIEPFIPEDYDIRPLVLATDPAVRGALEYSKKVDNTMYYAFEIDWNFNDNSYGINQIDWQFTGKDSPKHTFDKLVKSDHAKCRIIYQGASTAEFQIDLSAEPDYRSAGVSGDDGVCVSGDCTPIMEVATSTEWNILNSNWTDKLTTNPPRVPVNSYAPGNTTDPSYPWIYRLVYEFSVDLSGFELPDEVVVECWNSHNSPPKMGDADLVVQPPTPTPDAPCECPSLGEPCKIYVCDYLSGNPSQCVYQNRPAGTLCGRDPDTQCDLQDICNDAGECVPNFVTAGTPCDSGDSPHQDCDAPDHCDGKGGCTPTIAPSTHLCNSGDTAHEDCGAQDTCGDDGSCPPTQAPTDETCESGDSPHQDCDATDQCDGKGGCTPTIAPAGTPCDDQSEGVCDDANTCDINGVCQANHKPDGTDCDPDGSCEEKSCSGGTCSNTWFTQADADALCQAQNSPCRTWKCEDDPPGPSRRLLHSSSSDGLCVVDVQASDCSGASPGSGPPCCVPLPGTDGCCSVNDVGDAVCVSYSIASAPLSRPARRLLMLKTPIQLELTDFNQVKKDSERAFQPRARGPVLLSVQHEPEAKGDSSQTTPATAPARTPDPLAVDEDSSPGSSVHK